MERLTDEALLGDNWAEAARILRTFVQAEPHIPALIKLVELCVDAGFEDWLREAQSVLADAYLEAGKGASARYVLEDLLEHEPESKSHRERLQRARDMVGAAAAPATPVPQVESVPVDAAPHAEPPPMEIDLTNLLAGITAPAPAPMPPPQPEPVEMSDATADYTRGLEQMIGGDTEAAIVTLQRAARAPQWRFKAAYELGRLYVGQGNLRDGVEWLERAAESPVPTREEGHAVLYDLAHALEQQGEPARALAILIELNADAGEYRDVSRRIDELSRAQSGSRSR
jgi:tetratricopeptide (TPR) repeat protein